MLDDPTMMDSQPPRQDPAASRQQYADQGVARTLITSLLVILAFGAGWFGNQYVHRSDYVAPRTAQSQVNNEYLIVQAWDAITKHYVVTSAIDQQKMAYAAIQAMVQTLGDTGHTRFETAQQFQA
ncbi:MAG: hypothetical protein IVW57_07425, partial [Ktedonobacterales bacterium]|nr:hypothetical protein [Ktedonobacterales bacterium]